MQPNKRFRPTDDPPRSRSAAKLGLLIPVTRQWLGSRGVFSHGALRAEGGVTVYYSVWGLLVLIVDVWAIITIVQSSADTAQKVLWTVLVIIFPVLGLLLWLLLGPGRKRI